MLEILGGGYRNRTGLLGFAIRTQCFDFAQLVPKKRARHIVNESRMSERLNIGFNDLHATFMRQPDHIGCALAALERNH